MRRHVRAMGGAGGGVLGVALAMAIGDGGGLPEGVLKGAGKLGFEDGSGFGVGFEEIGEPGSEGLGFGLGGGFEERLQGFCSGAKLVLQGTCKTPETL